MKVLEDLALLENAIDVDAAAASFLSVTPPNRVGQVQDALAVLLPAYKAGTIFNVDYESYRTRLGRAFEDALDDVFKSVKLDYSDHSVLGFGLGLHSVPSLLKKLSKPKQFKVTSPEAVEKIRAFVQACLPIHQIIVALKKMVVKGKKPLSPEKAAAKAAQLAAKNVKTCACCFRPIATDVSGLIADHGYRIPRPGLKSSSCPGRQFRPLEVSDDGVKHMIKLYEGWIADTMKAIKAAPDKTTIVKKAYTGKMVTIAKGDPTWAVEFQRYMKDLENNLESDQEQLKKFQAVLANWKPETVTKTEGLRGLTSELRSLIS